MTPASFGRQQRLQGEHGAVLIHVGMAMVALLAISAIAIDAGVKWVARTQAQNAADAGALAGAVALAFDAPDDFSDQGPGKTSAVLYAQGNPVWGAAPSIVPADVTFPPCPDGSDDTCVRVNVYRNTDTGNGRVANPLPVFFAGLVGVPNQGVKATATAQIRTGNATECLRPWGIVDRWNEYLSPGTYGAPQPLDTFDTYAPRERDREPDVYVAPTADSPGTGFRLPEDQGRQFAIHTGGGNEAVSSGWYRNIDLPRTDGTDGGANSYNANIRSCNGYPTAIAANDTICPEPTAINTHEEKVYWAARGCVRVQTGVQQGPTIDGIREIIASDIGARWSPTMNDGRGGIANSAYTPSPRIVPIAVMDVGQYLQSDPSGSGGVLRIVNIFGFFIEGMGDIDRSTGEIIFNPNDPLRNNAQTVVGRLMTLPGMFTGTSTIDESASFLLTIILVR